MHRQLTFGQNCIFLVFKLLFALIFYGFRKHVFSICPITFLGFSVFCRMAQYRIHLRDVGVLCVETRITTKMQPAANTNIPACMALTFA